MTLTGHTDKRGIRNPRHGDAIALARANTAGAFLKNRLAAVRITVTSAGDRKPVASNRTKKGRAANRQLVITLP